MTYGFHLSSLVFHPSSAEKRERRYRNIRAELTNLQRLEVVQLETFLEQQALAGKRDLPSKMSRTMRGGVAGEGTPKQTLR